MTVLERFLQRHTPTSSLGAQQGKFPSNSSIHCQTCNGATDPVRGPSITRSGIPSDRPRLSRFQSPHSFGSDGPTHPVLTVKTRLSPLSVREMKGKQTTHSQVIQAASSDTEDESQREPPALSSSEPSEQLRSRSILNSIQTFYQSCVSFPESSTLP